MSTGAVAGVAGEPARRTVLDMDRYQWMGPVRGMARMGLRHLRQPALQLRSRRRACRCCSASRSARPRRPPATLRWTGILTSLLLIGWAAGGIVFGRIADRLGRTRTLLLTMGMYSLRNGGLRVRAEHVVARPLPPRRLARHRRRVGVRRRDGRGDRSGESGALMRARLLYSAAPTGWFLATFLVYQIQGVYFRAVPEVAWRYVFLSGLIPPRPRCSCA